MAQHSIGAYAGNVSGYQPAGDEVRADAGQPHPVGIGGTPQVRAPFTPPAGRLGKPPSAPPGKRQEQPEPPGDESPQEPGRDPWTYRLRMDEPSYGGYRPGVPTGTYRMADAITTDVRPAIESGAGKVIAGVIEDVL